MIELKELNGMVKFHMYLDAAGNENPRMWKDLSRRHFAGYEGTALSACLAKIGKDEPRAEVERLARLLDWEGEIKLTDMLEYIAEALDLAAEI